MRSSRPNLILNRDGKVPADGWYQIEVSGEHPVDDGRTQVIDAQARQSIVAAFAAEREAAGDKWAGMLVDADHLSHDLDHKTEAYGWLHEVEERDGELYGRIDLTDDLGKPAVTSRRYKFFTTEYDPEDLEDLGEGRVRPLRLAGLGFTNRPNNRGGKPISNRAGTVPDAGGTKETKHMQAIAEKLGLPAEATEAEVLAKIDELLAAKADHEATTEMNRYADRIPEDKKAEVKAAMIKNRASGLEMILSFPPPAKKEDPARIHNREGATAPAPVEKTKAGASDEGKAAAIRNRAHAIAKERHVPWATAFRAAQDELA